MPDGMVVLIGLAGLILLLILLGGAARIYADAGLHVFLWPRLDRAYELQHATRLAAVPWYLAIFAAVMNILYLTLFARHSLEATSGYLASVGLLAIAILAVHLLDYRRSRLAALFTLLIALALVGAAWWVSGSLVMPAILLPILLWSINGVRATFAGRTYA